MQTLWEYDLPTNENISDHKFESPILISKGHVFYIRAR